jgi:hypothetical protein
MAFAIEEMSIKENNAEVKQLLNFWMTEEKIQEFLKICLKMNLVNRKSVEKCLHVRFIFSNFWRHVQKWYSNISFARYFRGTLWMLLKMCKNKEMNTGMYFHWWAMFKKHKRVHNHFLEGWLKRMFFWTKVQIERKMLSVWGTHSYVYRSGRKKSSSPLIT